MTSSSIGMTSSSIGIIGAGKMGRGIATRFVAAGHDVYVTDHSAGEAQAAAAAVAGTSAATARATVLEEALTADFVVLALWYPQTIEVAAAHSETLAGSIVIDISNPLDSTFTRIDLPGDTSGAEKLSAAIPNSRVVKAFNTLPAPTLMAGDIDGMALDCFVASDDEEARARVIQLVEGSGLRALDAGRLDNARVLERITAFGIELGQRYGLGFDFGFKYLPTEQMSPSTPL